MYFMTKLEECLWMCGSLMGMNTDAPLLYNHIMSYKDKINDQHEVLMESIVSPRERAKHLKKN